MSKFKFPELEGWVTVARVSDELRVSRQAVHKMLATGVFTAAEVCQLGYGVKKPLYLISLQALSRLKNKRKETV